MAFKLKTKLIKPGYILIAICLTVALISLLLYMSRKRNVTSSRALDQPYPVATMPAPAATSSTSVQPSDEDVEDNEHPAQAPKHQSSYVETGRHSGVDINQVNGSEEFLQEAPAAVDYPSPQPFQFVPDPERAVTGTGYAAPSSEHANEVYAVY